MDDKTKIHGSEDTFEKRGSESFRRCSYCGSVHPRDLLKARDEGKIGTVDRSVDWKYGWPHKVYVEVDGVFAKFYNEHTLEPFLTKEEQIKLFEFVGYSFWIGEKGGIRFQRWNYVTEIPTLRKFTPLEETFLHKPVTVNFDHNPIGEIIDARENDGGIRITMRLQDGTILNASVGGLHDV